MGEGAHLDHRFAVRDDLARLRDAIEVTVSHDGSALEVELLKVLDHVVAEAQAVTGLTAFWRPSADV